MVRFLKIMKFIALHLLTFDLQLAVVKYLVVNGLSHNGDSRAKADLITGCSVFREVNDIILLIRTTKSGSIEWCKLLTQGFCISIDAT